MTEHEWLSCTDPTPMLEFLHGKASDRKLQLFAVACGRHCWPLLPDGIRRANLVAEQYLDGAAAAEAVLTAFMAGGMSRDEAEDFITALFDFALASVGYAGLAGISAHQPLLPLKIASQLIRDVRDAEQAAQCDILRDIFGSPGRPSPLLPPALLAWNNATVCRLAQAIYEERAFDRLPVLADALEEAGCTATKLLSHCRQQGEHVRGCWLVDLVLARE